MNRAPTHDADFAAACEAVTKAGKGFPTLADAAAVAWCAWKGGDAVTVHGTGLLGRLTLRAIEQMSELANELGVARKDPDEWNDLIPDAEREGSLFKSYRMRGLRSREGASAVAALLGGRELSPPSPFGHRRTDCPACGGDLIYKVVTPDDIKAGCASSKARVAAGGTDACLMEIPRAILRSLLKANPVGDPTAPDFWGSLSGLHVVADSWWLTSMLRSRPADVVDALQTTTRGHEIAPGRYRGRCQNGDCGGDFYVEAVKGHVLAACSNHCPEPVDDLCGLVERHEALSACSIRKLRQAPPQEWIIPGVVPARQVVLKLGDSGARKTFDAIHKGLCIAGGIDWYGRPVKRGRAMLVLLEGGDDQINRYLDGLARGIGADLDRLQEDMVLLRYHDLLKVDDDESWSRFDAMVDVLEPVWIGIDNLNRCRAKVTAGAGNDNAVVGQIMERLERLSHDKGVAIELLHHVNARGESLGARAAPQNVDVEFKMRAASASNDGLVTLELGTKNRAGPETLHKVQFRYVDRADGAIVPTEVKPKALKAISAEADSDPRREAVRKLLAEAPLNNSGLREELSWSFRTVKETVADMESEGEIEKVGGLWHLVGGDD